MLEKTKRVKRNRGGVAGLKRRSVGVTGIWALGFGPFAKKRAPCDEDRSRCSHTSKNSCSLSFRFLSRLIRLDLSQFFWDSAGTRMRNAVNTKAPWG